MGIIKRGKKGMYYCDFIVNGKRKSIRTGCYTKKEALRFEALEKQKMFDDSKMSPHERAAKTSLSDAIAQVYQARWKNNKSGEFTHARALTLLGLIGNIPVGKIDQDAIAHVTLKLDKRKITSSTVNRYLAILKTVLKHKRQAWDLIKLRKERKHRIRVISKEEEQQVLSLLRNVKPSNRNLHFPEVADLVEVLLYTGMRLGELLALKYDDVNFSANLLTIWISKGDRPRSIPMSSITRSILERRQIINPAEPFTISSFQAENAWKWVRKQMKLEHDKEFVLHHLRHSFASRLAGKDVSLYLIKELLGHSTIQVTEKYAHLQPGKLAQAVSVLEE
jgi:integrase